MKGPRFLAEASAEYEDAAVYYEYREPGLGGRFLLELDEAVAFAMEFPGAGTMVRDVPSEHGLRWTMVRSFPVKIVYAVRQDEVVIVAVFHARRRPDYWATRVDRREPRATDPSTARAERTRAAPASIVA